MQRRSLGVVMVVFDFFFEKLHLLHFFDNWVAQSYPHTKKLCAPWINKSIQNGERERSLCYASTHILLTLTRAPLGYFYNAPHWGGGGAISSPPPLISETTRPILKIQAAFESPGKTVKEKQILLTSVSRVTSQVRSKSKYSTFRAWWHRRAKLRC